MEIRVSNSWQTSPLVRQAH